MKKKLLHFLLFIIIGFASKAQTASNSQKLGMWGHGKEISNSIIKSMPFIHGWNFTFYWRDLEPQKGKYNWKLFDSQITTATNNGLYVGYMVWVGSFTPEWVYDVDGVPRVKFEDKRHNIPYFPYYLNPKYKEDYMAMLKAVSEHVKSLPPSVRSKILYWMSAEGSTGDVTPYKADPLDAKYNISDDQWQAFKDDAWRFMYQFGNAQHPQLHILINPANNGMYFDYLLAHYPKAWLKAGSLSHSYQFDDELSYYKRMQKVVRPDNNGLVNRVRAESETVQETGWFQASPSQNNFALVASGLHFGLDILNVRIEVLDLIKHNTYPYQFFNKYAGQRDPATATGAFCMLRDVLDVADTVRFPVSTYGSLTGNNVKSGAAKKNGSVNDGDEVKIKRAKEISAIRLQNILKEFAPYGAKNGTTPEEDKIVYKNDVNLEPKLHKENLRTDLMDKYFNDIGINLLPGNYSRFLEQYSPNTTSRGYWRVGPIDQVYGRYARSFDHEKGMSEMFFALNKHFFKDKTPHKIAFSVTYFDKGNGSWSFNYHNGKATTEAYQVKCGNTNRWITKTVSIAVNVSGKLPHDTDFSLKYLSGDNTIFSMLEIVRE